MILDDLKTDLEISGTGSDDYLVKYCINPAVRIAATCSLNLKTTTVNLVAGTQTYNLTTSGIASPVISSAGIQELIFDHNNPWPYTYKVDFYISNKISLVFTDPTIPGTSTMKLKYNGFYREATTSIDTDAPDLLHPSIKKWALAEYGLKQLAKASSGLESGAVEEKQEEGLRVRFSNSASQQKTLIDQKAEAEREMIDLGANGGFNFFSIQVI